MIKNFKHKGLRAFFEEGDAKGIKQDHVKKLRLILAKLNTCLDIKDMDFPGADLHCLKGDKSSFWSIKVNANWRLIFRLHDKNVYDVNYLDYH